MSFLPETGLEEAMLVAERLRVAVAAHTFPVGGGCHATCSIRVAVYPEAGQTGDDLTPAADRAMYAAKRLGRNQVRAATEPAVLALETIPRPRHLRDSKSWCQLFNMWQGAIA